MPARRLVPILLLPALVAAPAPAAAQGDDVPRLSSAVQNQIVHVEPRARARVSVAEEGRLRLRIAQEANGRIKILVVGESTAERNGGLPELTADVAGRSKLRGALVAVAGDEVRVATSYEGTKAVEAVEQALGGRYEQRIGDELIKAVDNIARVDPGPSADEGTGADGPGVPGVPGDDFADDFLDDVGDTIRTVFFAITAVVIFVVLVPFLIWFVRARRRRAEGAEDLEIDRAAARDELVAIGDILRELDVDVSLPGADPSGSEALSRAIDLYDKADRDLKKADTRRRLERAQASLYRARSAAELARQRLAGAPAGHSLDA